MTEKNSNKNNDISFDKKGKKKLFKALMNVKLI